MENELQGSVEKVTSPAPHRFYQMIIDAYEAAGRPFFHQVTPGEARAMLRASLAAAPPPSGPAKLVTAADATIPGPNGAIAIRRYTPVGPSVGTCVYFHSGGWVIGDLDFADMTCRRLAQAAQAEIVSVDYRLAPEHVYPAPLDDAYAALEWASRECPGKLVVIGESAGGNLAAACTILARDAGGPALAGQFLAYPVTDSNFETASYLEFGDKNWLLSTEDMRWFWNHYAPPEIDRTNPLLSPLRVADAAGLPPAMIIVGELDPLRDEGLAYAAKLSAAGVAVTTRCDLEMVHGYLAGASVIPIAGEALAQAALWVRQRLES